MQARAAALEPRRWPLVVRESIAAWPTTKGQGPTTIFHGLKSGLEAGNAARAAALEPRPWSLVVGESIAAWPTTKGQGPTTIFHDFSLRIRGWRQHSRLAFTGQSP